MAEYIRFGTVEPSIVIKDILSSRSTVAYAIGQDMSKTVAVKSLRLQTFAHKGLKCSRCGVVGTYFAIERHTKGTTDKDRCHLNLYGIKNGKEIMLTHDHIIARKLGGADNIDNCQTLCQVCNGAKAVLEGNLCRLKTQRNIHKAALIEVDQQIIEAKARLARWQNK